MNGPTGPEPVARSVPESAGEPLAGRVDGLDWASLAAGLEEIGCAQSEVVLARSECELVAGLYDEDFRFRSTVDMARHRFGEGRYRYFARPLPQLVADLRAAFWPHLLPIVRDWAERLGRPTPWPDDLDGWLDRCHKAGQTRPTPLMLSYGPGDWNALHRDLYGEMVFPLQVVLGLDRPGVDHTGGEFVMVEQRPRAQSRATATTIGPGRAVIFATHERPVRSSRGWSRGQVRHGVSVVHTGRRRTLGLVFHDAA